MGYGVSMGSLIVARLDHEFRWVRLSAFVATLEEWFDPFGWHLARTAAVGTLTLLKMLGVVDPSTAADIGKDYALVTLVGTVFPHFDTQPLPLGKPQSKATLSLVIAAEARLDCLQDCPPHPSGVGVHDRLELGVRDSSQSAVDFAS